MDDWVSFRHPNYTLSSASLQHFERIPWDVKNHTIYAFDLPAFAADYDYEEEFVHNGARAVGTFAKS